MSISINAIICDDLRKEDNGKLIAIGIYTNDILLSNPEIQNAFSIWLKVEGLEEGNHKHDLVFSQNGEELIKFNGIFYSDGNDVINAILHQVPFKFKSEGSLEISIIFENEIVIKTTPIEIKFSQNDNTNP